MQPEESVEVDCAVTRAERAACSDWSRDRDARTEGVVRSLTVWNHDVQSVCCTALKEADESLPLRCRRKLHPERRAPEKAWTQSHRDEGEPAGFYEYSAVHNAFPYRRWNS